MAEKRPSLNVLSGPLSGQKFVLEDAVDNILIGSDPSCGFVLDTPGVSPIHARLWVDLNGATVYDTNSPTGVYVNDDRVVKEAPVRNGDILWLGPPGEEGSVLIQCILPPPPAPAAAEGASAESAAAAPAPPKEGTAPLANDATMAFGMPAYLPDEPELVETPPPADAEGSDVDSTVVMTSSDLMGAPPPIPAPREPEPEPTLSYVPSDATALLDASDGLEIVDEPTVAMPPPVPRAAPAPPAPAPPPVAAASAAEHGGFPDFEVEPTVAMAPPPLPVRAATPPPAPVSEFEEDIEPTVVDVPSPTVARTPSARPAALAPINEDDDAATVMFRPSAAPPPPAPKPAAAPAPRARAAAAPAAAPPPSAARGGGGGSKVPLFAGAGVAVLVVLGLAGWWFTRKPAAPTAEASPVAPPPVAESTPPPVAVAPPVTQAAAPPETQPPVAVATPIPEAVTVVRSPVPSPKVAAATPPPPKPGATPAGQKPAATPPPVNPAQQTAAAVANLMSQARTASDARNYDAAVSMYDEVLKLEPGNGPATSARTAAIAARNASRKTFVAGRTVVSTEQKAKGGLSGFDGADVVQKSADFSGRLEFAMNPATVKPGDSFRLTVALVNDGKKAIKISGMTYSFTVNGNKTGNPVMPKVKEVGPASRVVLEELPGMLPADASSFVAEVLVTANKGDSLKNQLTWK